MLKDRIKPISGFNLFDVDGFEFLYRIDRLVNDRKHEGYITIRKSDR